MEREQDARQQREKLQGLVDRANGEPQFRQQLRDDPIAVLQQAGVPIDLIGDYLREEGYAHRDPNDPKLTGQERAALARIRQKVDVTPAMACWDECCFTCWCTECCITRI